MPPLVPVRRLYHALLTYLIPQDKEQDPAPFSPQPCATGASSQNQQLGDDCCAVHKAPLFNESRDAMRACQGLSARCLLSPDQMQGGSDTEPLCVSAVTRPAGATRVQDNA